MLAREDYLRLSAPVQARFADPSFDAILIAEQVQKQVVEEFYGTDASEDVKRLGLEIMRSAPTLYPDYPEIRRIPHYLKYNRSRKGELDAGSLIPDAYLAHLTGAPTTLFECLRSITSSSDHQLSSGIPLTTQQHQQLSSCSKDVITKVYIYYIRKDFTTHIFSPFLVHDVTYN